MHLRTLEAIGAIITPDFLDMIPNVKSSFQGPKYFRINLLIIVSRKMGNLTECYLS